jgi:hypothetical protein
MLLCRPAGPRQLELLRGFRVEGAASNKTTTLSSDPLCCTVLCFQVHASWSCCVLLGCLTAGGTAAWTHTGERML